MKPLVFLCMPRYSAQVDARADASFMVHATLGACNVKWGSPELGGSPIASQTSVLPQAFNAAWVMALNLRSMFRITHFAMLHADVEAEPGWVDILVSEQLRLHADVVSAVIPFKMETGQTSTALGDPSWPRNAVCAHERPRRLTLHEAHKLPATFCADDIEPGKVLMVNTGCWVCDFTKPWAEDICFTFHNLNYRDASGRFHTACRTEDFDASFQFYDLGLKVFATTAVKAIHHGDWGYANWPAWGSWQTDEQHKRQQEINSGVLGVVAADQLEQAGVGAVAAVSDDRIAPVQ